MRSPFLVPILLAISSIVPAFAQQAQPDFNALNAAFGIPIWENDNLWSDSDAALAQRLRWPQESQTSTENSYRLYPRADDVVLGTRPFSLALYGADGKPSQISMVFANKGDVAELAGINRGQALDMKTRIAAQQATLDYKKYIRQDSDEIQKKLTDLLGPPKNDQIGQARDTREQVKRWDWKGHSILLASPRDEYVAVRIVPTASLASTTIEHVSQEDMRKKLQARVEHRANGDVVLQDLPMVNQGPKGYCGPATWERVLRYMGIPADMYVLAMAGKTDAGGGTRMDSINGGMVDVVNANGRRLTQDAGQVQTRNIARYTDAGLPVIWYVCVDEPTDKMISQRTQERQAVTDWAAWKKSLEPYRKAASKIPAPRDQGHVRLIIGYNDKTGEIAISDSWGSHYAERWMTVEEANAMSQHSFTVVNF